MSRTLTIAVVAALALPVLALAALIGEQELRYAKAQVVNVPVRGIDPRDLLLGHYLVGQFDWDWESEPDQGGTGGLCVLSGDAARPKVRFIEEWNPHDRIEGCRLVIAGRLLPRHGSVQAAFVPATLDSGSAGMRFYVSEARAPELEEQIRKQPGSVTADLAVRRDGSAAIQALRLDGQVVGR